MNNPVIRISDDFPPDDDARGQDGRLWTLTHMVNVRTLNVCFTPNVSMDTVAKVVRAVPRCAYEVNVKLLDGNDNKLCSVFPPDADVPVFIESLGHDGEFCGRLAALIDVVCEKKSVVIHAYADIGLGNLLAALKDLSRLHHIIVFGNNYYMGLLARYDELHFLHSFTLGHGVCNELTFEGIVHLVDRSPAFGHLRLCSLALSNLQTPVTRPDSSARTLGDVFVGLGAKFCARAWPLCFELDVDISSDGERDHYRAFFTKAKNCTTPRSCLRLNLRNYGNADRAIQAVMSLRLSTCPLCFWVSGLVGHALITTTLGLLWTRTNIVALRLGLAGEPYQLHNKLLRHALRLNTSLRHLDIYAFNRENQLQIANILREGMPHNFTIEHLNFHLFQLKVLVRMCHQTAAQLRRLHLVTDNEETTLRSTAPECMLRCVGGDLAVVQRAIDAARGHRSDFLAHSCRLDDVPVMRGNLAGVRHVAFMYCGLSLT